MVQDGNLEALEVKNRPRACFFHVCSFSVWMAALLLGSAHAWAAVGDPSARVARLAHLTAQVSLEPAGTNQWTQAAPNTPLTTGDRLYVNHEGHAELQMGELAVRAWKFTDLSVVNLADHGTQLAVAQGSLHVRTFGLRADRPVEVDTPNGAFTVLQPGDFRLDVYTNGGGTLVTVDAGAIQISGPGVAKIVGAGESVHMVGSNPIHVLVQRMPGKDPFDIWSLQRDRAFLSSEARRYVNPDTVGSEDLDAYGKWSETLEFGPVWYPSNLPAGWSPYSNGRWTWISPWGWTWVDADAWGFAPFHYGRWTDLGSRWGWIPGPSGVAPVYAPAMVAFVGGGGFSSEAGKPLAGWIPLGAGEPFYPAYACSRACFTEVNLSNLSDARSNPRHVNASNYFGYYHTRWGFRSIRYVHQKAATIAVPSDLFAAGGAVTPETVTHPTAQQWRAARILSHPLVAPTVQSVVPQLVSPVPVPAERTPVIVALNPGATRAPQSGTGESAPQPGGGFWLIGRTPPPAAGPSFEQQMPALRQNAGRPLDPGQWNNLAAGRSAGAPTMREFPPESISSTYATSRRAGVK
ncbi:MAG: DUF6600 domain-containing protein [Acidobacteriaceae bacterium]